MSLSQATSPEEAKRELKQQVFLAIQGKYDTRQTSQLIEDIDTITNAIMGSTSSDNYVQGEDGYYLRESVVDMDAPEKLIQSVGSMPMRGAGLSINAKEHIFIGGRHDGDTRQLAVNNEFKPLQQELSLTISSDCGHHVMSRTSYYRHHLTVVTGGWSVTRWFYCDEKNIGHWTEQKLLSTLDRINKILCR